MGEEQKQKSKEKNTNTNSNSFFRSNMDVVQAADNQRKPRLFRPWILYPHVAAAYSTTDNTINAITLDSSSFNSDNGKQQQITGSLHQNNLSLINTQPSTSIISSSLASSLSSSASTSSISSYGLNKTRKQRPKKFRCPHCHVSFSNNGQLKGHVRIHTGERPFKCDHSDCGKTFTRNEELTRHKRIHSGVRPFPCQVCGKRFGRKDHLKKHVKTHQRPTQLVAPATLLPPGVTFYSYYLNSREYLQPHQFISW